MLNEGKEAMADAELLAMLIVSGSPRETGVALAGRILSSIDFNLKRLSAITIAELCAFRGMGHAKSSSIVAAMELGKRLAEQYFLLSISSNAQAYAAVCRSAVAAASFALTNLPMCGIKHFFRCGIFYAEICGTDVWRCVQTFRRSAALDH
jgi:DNA repair protein RadC